MEKQLAKKRTRRSGAALSLDKNCVIKNNGGFK